MKCPTANSGLAKGGLTCFDDTFVLKQTFVLRMNFSAKNPALRQAANRYPKCRSAPFWITCRASVAVLLRAAALRSATRYLKF